MTTTAQYVIASQEGMAPFATAANKKEALKFSRQARMLGFCGQIVKFETPPIEDQTPRVIIQIGARTFRISKYKPNGYSIHCQRGTGGWHRWMRLHHQNDRADVETIVQLVRSILPAGEIVPEE
jgi:hypothetical protein